MYLSENNHLQHVLALRNLVLSTKFKLKNTVEKTATKYWKQMGYWMDVGVIYSRYQLQVCSKHSLYNFSLYTYTYVRKGNTSMHAQ